MRAAHRPSPHLLARLPPGAEHGTLSHRFPQLKHLRDESVRLVTPLMAVRVRAWQESLCEVSATKSCLAQLTRAFVVWTAQLAPLNERVREIGKRAPECAYPVEKRNGSVLLTHRCLRSPIVPISLAPGSYWDDPISTVRRQYRVDRRKALDPGAIASSARGATCELCSGF